MQKGKAILPAEAGMLAILAKSFIFVYQRPRVSILSTGDELADLDERFNEEKIVNSNSYAIAAQVKEAGGAPIPFGFSHENPPHLYGKNPEGLETHPLSPSAGGPLGAEHFLKPRLHARRGGMLFFE